MIYIDCPNCNKIAYTDTAAQKAINIQLPDQRQKLKEFADMNRIDGEYVIFEGPNEDFPPQNPKRPVFKLSDVYPHLKPHEQREP